MGFIINSTPQYTLDLSDIHQIINDEAYDEICVYYKKDNSFSTLKFDSKQIRCGEYDRLYCAWKKYNNKINTKIPNIIRSFLDKYKETIICLTFLLLLDEFIFEGKFRRRIKSIVEKLFTRTENAMLKEN